MKKTQKTVKNILIKELRIIERIRQEDLKKLEEVRNLYDQIHFEDKILLDKRLAEER